MHPFAGDLSLFKDIELEHKVTDLSKKYHMTANPAVRNQVAMLLEMYNAELRDRRQAALTSSLEQKNKSFDSLIKIS